MCCCSNRSRSIRPNLISAWERPRQLAIRCCICHPAIPSWRVRRTDAARRTDAGLAALRHRLIFAWRKLRGSQRLSDVRVAIYGPAALTALARRAGELCCALPKEIILCGAREPKLFFEPQDFSALIADPDIIGLHISRKAAATSAPLPAACMHGRRNGSPHPEERALARVSRMRSV